MDWMARRSIEDRWMRILDPALSSSAEYEESPHYFFSALLTSHRRPSIYQFLHVRGSSAVPTYRLA